MERELATGGDRQELAARIRELTGRIEREKAAAMAAEVAA